MGFKPFFCMGSILAFEDVKLIVGLLYSGAPEYEGLFTSICGMLADCFGEIDYQSRPMLFSFTNYYDKEIPPPIYKRIISFKQLINPQSLSSIKIKTNELEQLWVKKLAINGESKIASSIRPVNLDPGILDLSHLILATTKNRGHRLPLCDGIYGELTLLFMNGEFKPLEWTYDDFATDEYRAVLCEIRKLYKIQRKIFLKQ